MMAKPSKLVFATRNANKVEEVNRIFTSAKVTIGEIVSLDSINCREEIPETRPTIAANAEQKARYIFENYGMNCFAEDTGLCIDALNGEPGVLSARYAGNQKSSDNNIDLVLSKLAGSPNRKAHFLTVVALILDEKTHLFEGKINGTITQTRKGKSGFGYDPIFLPTGHSLTFGQMNIDLKNRISHRFRAFQKLINYFQK